MPFCSPDLEVMGAKSSNLNWFDHQLSLQKPPGKYKSRCYNLSPPSYNHNWTDLHYAASHGNVRRIQEILHKSGKLQRWFKCQFVYRPYKCSFRMSISLVDERNGYFGAYSKIQNCMLTVIYWSPAPVGLGKPNFEILSLWTSYLTICLFSVEVI